MSRIPIKYSPGYGRMLLFVGVPQRAAYIEIDDSLVRVHLGWTFHASFHRDAVESVERGPDVKLTAGAHGWRGRWLVNGAAGPIVVIHLRGHGRAWVTGFPVGLRVLSVSVDDPDALIAALT